MINVLGCDIGGRAICSIPQVPCQSVRAFPQNDKGFLLLDGHLRLAIVKELGAAEAKSLLATEEGGYTYNKRVNYIPPVAQHLMLFLGSPPVRGFYI
jgi:hypothetical protein